MDIAAFLWDFLAVPAVYALDREQTVTRPALSGNNIHRSGRHFLRSDEEIPPLIRCGKENTLTYFLWFDSEGKERQEQLFVSETQC